MQISRLRYFFKNLICSNKKVILKFIPLDNLNNKYCGLKTTISKNDNVYTALPRRLNENKDDIQLIRFPIKIFQLKNLLFIPNASYFLNPKYKTLYYEKWHDKSNPIVIYSTSILLEHYKDLAKVRKLPIKKLTDDEVIFLGGTFTFNYYHFLIEILSKTQFLTEIPNHKNKTIILDQVISNIPSMLEIASFFLKDYNIKYLDDNTCYQADKIWHITSPNYTIPNIKNGELYKASYTKISFDSINYLRETAFSNFNINNVSIKKINNLFIRRKSKNRVYNEEEIFTIATRYGFESIFFEDLNIHEQIFLFNQADYIISPSGAAWTNLVFAKNGGKGLTWLSNEFSEFSCYSTIASIVNFKLLFCNHEPNTVDPHGDYYLDPKIFLEHLNALLQ